MKIKLLSLIIVLFFSETLFSIAKQLKSDPAEETCFPVSSPPKTPIIIEGGPSQPEVQSFTPADVTNMVNLFTGDFSYNIPLMDIGGYPVNITYQQGVGMEEDAGAVGLGWNLSVGSINRIVRGLPDDFCGDEIDYEQYQKPNITYGIAPQTAVEVFGFGVSMGASFRHNNYSGMAVDLTAGLSYSFNMDNGFGGQLGCTVGLNSDNGPYYSPNIGMSYGGDYNRLGANFGYKASSFNGFESASFGVNYSMKAVRSNDRGQKKDIPGQTMFSAAISGSHSFNSITSIAPKRLCAMTNYGFTGKIHVGGEIQGVTLQGGIGSFYSEQRIAQNKISTPAYGYLFSQKAGHGNVLLDFQRDEETGIDDKVPNLPATAFTYDLFQVSGQGLSGQFRAYRNDVGIVHDPYIASGPNPDVNIGLEAEIGSLVGLGADVGLAIAQNQSGEWTETNEITKLASFTDTTGADPAYKPYYFKEVGEATLFDNDIYRATQDTAAVRLETSLGYLHKSFRYGINQQRNIDASLINHKTPKCNTLFTALYASEAAAFALDKKIANYPRATHEMQFPTPIQEERENEFRNKHHISEITVTKDDGIRYVYGIPAYNTYKNEVSFNVSGAADSLLYENIVKYSAPYTNHKHNTNGLNHAFSSTATPAYAYAYLLTNIISADYVDRTGDGPTADDNGSYTKFNYHKASGRNRWRMPYLQNSAHLQENTNNLHAKSDGDDMASFIYGEKEVWYNQSIETKNYVALFYYSPRMDARGVRDQDGGIDLDNPDQQLLKLDSISLFTRVSPGIPIQTVHFTYDYSLCKGTPTNIKNYNDAGNLITDAPDPGNQTKGKLTLTGIYFTYQNSKKGKLIRYQFGYQNNRNYDDSKNDRWGNYKENRGDFASLSNKDFPYVQQKSKPTADLESAAWCLSRIITPASAAIDIHYESDDYAYVQDKPAMQMIKILGFGRSSDISSTSGVSTITRDQVLITPTNRSVIRRPHHDVEQDIIFFKLPRREYLSDNAETLLRQMSEGVKELFFNMSTNIGIEYENVTGFMITQDFGLARYNTENIGWVKIAYRPGQPEINGFHPVTLAAFRYALENLPRIAKGESGELPDDINEAFTELSSRMGDMFTMLASGTQNDWMLEQHIGDSVNTSESYIRLNNPYRSKFGGGARVRRITISDNWNSMSGDSTKIYGVEYDYSTIENGRVISSGVASFEPETGNDENPVYLPVRVRDYDDPKYRRVVAPIGRALFPVANVGYAKVTVRSLQHAEIGRTATGKTEHEFYTARDFPVFTNSTVPQMTSNMDSPGEHFANAIASMFYHEDQLTVSQGHVIELNDMHGKPKSISVYQQGNTNAISGTSYIYKTKASNPKKLNNRIDFISPDGTVTSGLGAMESDFVIDTRYSWDRTWAPTVNFNINTFLVGPYPIPAFTFFPMLRYDGTLVHVVSATKVIHQTGILDSMIVFDNGAKVTTKNIAYDSETGLHLLSETSNEFRDKYYTLNVPAHWVEPGMGQACFNTGNQYQILTYTAGNGFATIKRPDGVSTGNYFFKGDEVFIKSNFNDRIWVDSVESTRIRLIDRNGNYPVLTGPFTNTSLKVIRSGKRNMQSIPVGSITMQENPIINGVTHGTRRITETWNKVVNASATKYADQWQTYNIQRVSIPSNNCVCEENKRGVSVIHQILGWLTGANGPRNFNFSNLTVTSGVISDQDRLLYFGSGSLEISSSTFGNCVEIRLNRNCTISLCSEDGQPLTGPISPISGISTKSNIASSGNEGCPDQYSFSAAIHFGAEAFTYVSSNARTVQVNAQSSCIPLNICNTNPSSYTNTACNLVTGTLVNPYVEGIRGNYRPHGSYVYNKGERINSTASGPLPLRISGFYDNQFRPFWVCAAFRNAAPALWTTSSTVTKIDPNGRALETKDPTGVYSADLYGFNQNLVIASAQNAAYNQIAFESFEDFDYPIGNASGGCPSLEHWPLFLYSDAPTGLRGGVVDNSISHTGKNSLRLIPGSSHTTDVSLLPISNNHHSGAYQLKRPDLTGYFKPSPGAYYISAWLKKDVDPYNDGIYATYESARVRVNGVELDNRTNIIDGWQQIWGIVTITEEQSQLSVQLISGTTFTNFDDIRIQPVTSSMKTYVYRPDNLRLCAELDENNFATLYEYDDEGALTRTKKETEQGVMTLQEVRFANPKTP